MVYIDSSRFAEFPEWVEFNSSVFRRFQRDSSQVLEPGYGFLPSQTEHFQLKKDLAVRIAKLAHLERLRDLDSVSQESLVMAGQDTLSALDRIQQEWIGFLRRLVRIDISRLPTTESKLEEDVREALVKDAIEKVVNDIFTSKVMMPLAISSPFTAESLSRDLESTREAALSSLVYSVGDLVERMMQQLDALVEYSVCGMITRLPKGSRKFSYRYRKIGMRDLKSDNRFIRKVYGGPYSETGDRIVNMNEVFYMANFDITVCFREHHLIHAIETDPYQGVVAVPEFHQQVLANIPQWLKPFTNLVEGTVVGVFEGDRLEDSIELEHTTGLRIYYHADPALVLGQHVLTAWGPDELAAEAAKKKEARQAAADNSVLRKLWSRLNTI